ncbi:uncharacterized protein LOC143854680 [Tasmannia lanceolata]|uniref:uncharacterized protein LOC143854680 n=1 Tax=Tasmannia lanceolata TaxID=3420 RepID=UPI004062D787
MLELEDQIHNLTICPSLSRFSAERFGETADQIIREEEKTISAGDPAPIDRSSDDQQREEDDDFEFAFVSCDPDALPITADEIFSNGQIRPIFPIFNGDLIFSDENQPEKKEAEIRIPIRKLLNEERDHPSSSKSKELVGLTAGSYCVWTPKSVQSAPSSPDLGKKSNSTGTSKRWRFRNFHRRSSSDGKETFVFLSAGATTAKKDEKKENIVKAPRIPGEVKIAGKGKSGEKASPHEMHYMRNRAIKDGDRRRSFLPYRQDIVGFFANTKGLSRSLHPSF